MAGFMLVCLSWGVVGDGRRPIVKSEMNGHAILPPFLIFSCIKHAPTKCSVKCLNVICVWFCEIWLVERIVHIWMPL